MDLLERLTRQAGLYLWALMFVSGLVIIAVWLVGTAVLSLPAWLVMLLVLGISAGMSYIFAHTAAILIMSPLRLLWQAILHVSPGPTRTAAPDLKKLSFGRELVTSLSLEVYQLATKAPRGGADDKVSKQAKAVLGGFPLPVLVADKKQNVVFANEQAGKYLQREAADIMGQNLYSVLDLSFSTDDTLDTWLENARQNSVTAGKTWQRVRLKQTDGKSLLFDMAAYYNQNNPSGVELILTLFDHTADYSSDEEGVNYLSLAVHELRTPLTMLRGYIEVFDEELEGKLDPQLAGFLSKMQATSQQLTALVNNILNVARVDADQLTLQLTEEHWDKLLQGTVDNLELIAKVHGKTIECEIAPNLPTVGVDHISISEVLSNLIDNAIKYGDKSPKIVIKSSLTKDGLVETTVQDWGVGIPEAVIPNLFQKFSRNHRNRAKISGTGLGLYLSKAIVAAHGGSIWVKSKEGQGTTIGFSLQPYVIVAQKLKSGDNDGQQGLVRNAHGWIKNHSLYRR